MKEIKGWAMPDNDMHFEIHLLQYPGTTYQQLTIDASYNFVKKFNTVIDVGGNVGLHTVRFAQKFKHVHSFEPVTSNFKCLEENCKSFTNIVLHNYGLGSCNEETVISLPASSDNCGNYSIVDFQSSSDELIKEEIQIIKLDDLQLEVDLIKIDTQGFEFPVLQGAIKTIERCKPVIILEAMFKIQFDALSSFLTKLGYVLATKIKCDYIWVHKENQ
jgi:FkbM family methyltransferase